MPRDGTEGAGEAGSGQRSDPPERQIANLVSAILLHAEAIRRSATAQGGAAPEIGFCAARITDDAWRLWHALQARHDRRARTGYIGTLLSRLGVWRSSGERRRQAD